MKADGLVNFFRPAFPKGAKQILLCGRIFCEDEETRCIAVQPMHGENTVIAQGKEEGLRLHARKFIGDQHVIICVNFAVKGFGFLGGGRVIGDLVAGGERHVLFHPHAVYAHV